MKLGVEKQIPRVARNDIFEIVLVALLVLAPTLLHGQVAPKRLSDWLLEQRISADDYPLGLSWRVPGEVVTQGELRLELLKSLSGLDREVSADAAVLGRLRDWVRGLPVTGRVPVAVPDARWLQANPSRDPMLQPGHSVVLPKRPRTVTVITARGTRCAVTHSPGHESMAYVQACSPFGVQRVDWAWVAQPDGRVQRFGVAAWNREAQDEPAPGAWIWAPPRDGGFPEHLSQRLIAFLATQGPASDSDPDAGIAVGAGEMEQRSGATASSGATTSHASQSASGSASEAWVPSGLPELGGIAQGERDPDRPIEGGRLRTMDANRTAALPALVPAPSVRSRSLVTTASDWGGVGLLQTPSARMETAGNFSVNFSRIYPYFQGNIMVQPLDWLEAGFRYTTVSNRLYSADPNFSGNTAALDKSFDAKFWLWRESAYVPEVALGLRDVAGTGLFSGEYLVASKRTGSLDWSLGLGWGYPGARGNLRNPLSLIGSKFDTRTTNVGQGGGFSFGSYFHGPTALFGGVQYHTPWAPLILKLEYDGNDYQHEGLGNNLRQSSPWNFGVVYRAARSVDVSLGVERGNTAMLGVTLHTQLDGLSVPKLSDPPRVAVAQNRPLRAPDWSATSRDIAVQTDWHVRRIEQRGRELRVTLDDAEAIYWRERADRAAAVLHRDAPASVDRFALAYRQHGVEVAEHLIERDAWVAEQTQPLPPREQRAAVMARAAGRSPAANALHRDTRPTQIGGDAERLGAPNPLYQHTRPTFEAGLGPHYQQTLGGPDGFVLFQVGAVEKAKLRLREDTWLQGTLQLGLLDNYNKFSNRGSSDMPRVRTFLREYVTSSKLTVPNLQATHVGRLGENQYYSLYGGYLEAMFAGVGGEWLYRPFASRIAFGVDANLVQQRNFRQDLGFDDAGSQTGYRVGTGHATLYWDTGWNSVQANLSAGRYLAKDAGVTVALSRVFRNGVKFGAFFSKTNVSAERFGEGSFDKGVYLSVPFDAFLTRSSITTANVTWKPLTRDGGAKLSRSVELYELTNTRDDRALRYRPAPRPNDESIPADRREPWTPPPKGPEPYTRVMPRPTSEQWLGEDARGVGGLQGQPHPHPNPLPPKRERGSASSLSETGQKGSSPSPPAMGEQGFSPSPPETGERVGVRGRSSLEMKSADKQRGPDARGYEQRLVQALYRQEFRNIRVAYHSSYRLTIALSNDNLTLARSYAPNPISRAVGRVARTALRLGPLDMRELRITFAERANPAVSYEFLDIARLDQFFNGRISAAQLADSVAIDYIDPSVRENDPLARLDDMDTTAEEKRLVDVLLPDTRFVARVASDFSAAGRTAADVDWLRIGVLGTGLVLLSGSLDRPGDQFAKDHAENRWLKGMNRVGTNAIPWLAIGGAAAAALDGSNPVLSRTGYAALEAGGTALLAVTGLKYLVGRARPGTVDSASSGAGGGGGSGTGSGNEVGNHAFKPFSTTSGYDSLPSGHSAIVWAVATPFAEQYDAPWLYGVAAITSLARVGSRQHWVSDTVAGSLLGYAIGKVFWESSRASKKGAPRVMIHPSGINMAWELN